MIEWGTTVLEKAFCTVCQSNATLWVDDLNDLLWGQTDMRSTHTTMQLTDRSRSMYWAPQPKYCQNKLEKRGRDTAVTDRPHLWGSSAVAQLSLDNNASGEDKPAQDRDT